MLIIFLIVLFIIIFFGGGLIFFTAKKNKTLMFAEKDENGNAPGKYDSNKAENVMNILPIKDISNDVLFTLDDRIVGYIEVQSLNYGLKTDVEQNVIEDSFRDILGILPYNISFLVSTRNLDTENIVESTSIQLEKTLQEFPHLAEYGEKYLDSVSNYSANLGVYKKKIKLIAISIDLFGEEFDDDLSEDERYIQALGLMNEAINVYRAGLISTGVPGAERLSSKQIAALFGGVFHRDNVSISKYFDEYSSNLVDGHVTPFGEWSSDEPLNPYAATRLWLHQVQNRMSNEIFNNSSISEADKYELVDVLKQLKVIKDSYKEKAK